jgi:hypothetical protein
LGGFRIFFFGKIGKRRKWGKRVVRRRLREAGDGGVVVGWCGRVVFWRMRDGGGVSRKRENGGVREVGGGLVWWRMAGDGVLVVEEVDAGGGWRWVCVFWMFREMRDGGEGRGLCTAEGKNEEKRGRR